MDSRPIGIILPPRDIREIIDKTAESVAQMGSSFEELVIRSEGHTPKFSFLKPDDPYRPYYDQKVIDYAKAIVREQQGLENGGTQPKPQDDPDVQAEEAREPAFVPKERYSVDQPSSISLIDIEIIKTTALFVAKNGSKFMTKLTENEKENPSFDFLKPTHHNFQFFNKLTEVYSFLINPKRDEYEKELLRLRHFIVDRSEILNHCGVLFQHKASQKQAKLKFIEKNEQEKRKPIQPLLISSLKEGVEVS